MRLDEEKKFETRMDGGVDGTEGGQAGHTSTK